MGALAIDDRKYARVLAKVLPRVITSGKEHARMLAEAEKLMDKVGETPIFPSLSAARIG